MERCLIPKLIISWEVSHSILLQLPQKHMQVKTAVKKVIWSNIIHLIHRWRVDPRKWSNWHESISMDGRRTGAHVQWLNINTNHTFSLHLRSFPTGPDSHYKVPLHRLFLREDLSSWKADSWISKIAVRCRQKLTAQEISWNSLNRVRVWIRAWNIRKSVL